MSGNTSPELRPKKLNWNHCAALFAIITMILIAIGLLAPGVGSRRPSNEHRCRYNLEVIAGALREYYDDYGTLPPTTVADSNGRPMHSWRVLILPYLHLSDLYKMYDFSQPWDSEHNRELLLGTPYYYRCPACGALEDNAFTNYVAVTGPGTIWDPSARTISLDSIESGEHNPIVVVEIAGSDIHWFEPRDLDLASMNLTINEDQHGISSRHRGGANVLRCGGDSTKINGQEIRIWKSDFLRNATPPDELRTQFLVDPNPH